MLAWATLTTAPMTSLPHMLLDCSRMMYTETNPSISECGACWLEERVWATSCRTYGAEEAFDDVGGKQV